MKNWPSSIVFGCRTCSIFGATCFHSDAPLHHGPLYASILPHGFLNLKKISFSKKTLKRDFFQLFQITIND